VIRLDHRDILERGQRAGSVALLAQDARTFPVELGKLVGVVGNVEPLCDQLEHLFGIATLSHPAKQPVECDCASGVLGECALECALAFDFVSQRVERQDGGLLEELGRSSSVDAQLAKLGASNGLLFDLAERIGCRPEPFPGEEIVGSFGGDRIETRQRFFRVPEGEVIIRLWANFRCSVIYFFRLAGEATFVVSESLHFPKQTASANTTAAPSDLADQRLSKVRAVAPKEMLLTPQNPSETKASLSESESATAIRSFPQIVGQRTQPLHLPLSRNEEKPLPNFHASG